MNPIRITPEMVEALKKHISFPEFAIGGENAEHPDHWLAHLRDPFFVAKVEGDADVMQLRVVPLCREIDLVKLAEDGHLKAAAAYLGVDQVSAYLRNNAPEHIFVQHDAWIGIVHTRRPRFVYESKQPGFTVVLDPWDDIGPVLRRAAEWYGRMIFK